nr:MAG TPA: hypothetical protein [Caudoviricetes sp.]DAY79243.1 MAG TPA: hypothetical protein [Caudoviricetes sp.]
MSAENPLRQSEGVLLLLDFLNFLSYTRGKPREMEAR